LFLFFVYHNTYARITITDLGAKGDGVTDNTEIIQKAIDQCSGTSAGTVIVPPGKYLTRPLFMRSNVRLHIEAGAELLGSTRLKDYSDVFPVLKGKESPALIYAENKENISVTGHGTINGQGGHAEFQHGNDSQGGPRRPKIIYFRKCKNVTVTDITLRNSAYWTQDYEQCDGVFIRGVKVYSHCNYNNDGLDIDSRNVIVSDCYIDTDDDALCFKSDFSSVCENITVSNCVLASNCNAIKFGTASLGGFRNITVTNCVVRSASEDNIRKWKTNKATAFAGIQRDTTVLAGIALESVDGGVMDGISVSNVLMSGVQTPVFIRLGDRRRTYSKGNVSILKNIQIHHIIAQSESLIACSVTGVPGSYAENISLRDIHITAPGGGTKVQAEETVKEAEKGYPENRMFGSVLPASGFYVRHVKNITFQNVSVITRKPDIRPVFYFDDVTDGRLNLSEDAEVKQVNSKNILVNGK
jgi:polygalacturonase